MSANPSMARRALLLALVVVTALGCGRFLARRTGGGDGGGGGEGRGGAGGDAGGGATFEELSEIYGGDGCGAPKRTGEMFWRFQHQGATWRVPVWIPPGAGPRSGVVLLHPGGGAGGPFARASGYVEFASEVGAILVAPDAQRPEMKEYGDHKIWRSGRPGSEDFGWIRDDVAFLDAISDRLRREACAKDILATGFSDGAAMALTWNCGSSRNPDAMVLGAAIAMQPDAVCVRKDPVPARMYVGAKDPRYKVGENILGPKVISVLETAELYARANGCDGGYDTEKDAPDTTCRQYRGCKRKVEFCVVEDFGHNWPGPPESRADGTRDGYRWFRRLRR